ncbi:hypothetical protein GCM10027418_22660 [Mariniluteicoccus endophyticus]
MTTAFRQRVLAGVVLGALSVLPAMGSVASAAPTPSVTPTPTPTPTVAPTPTATPGSRQSAATTPTPASASGGPSATPTPRAMAVPRSGTFRDEFYGEAGAVPNPELWRYEMGRGTNGWGSGEKQFYTTSTNNSWIDGNGHLVIQAKYEPEGRTYAFGDDHASSVDPQKRWSSARLMTDGNFSTTYGRMEARIKVPQGKGVVPSFWMGAYHYGSGSGFGPNEIAIMRGQSDHINNYSSHVSGRGRTAASWNHPILRPLGDDFHVYSVQWTPETLQFFFDDRLMSEVTRSEMGSDWLADIPHHVGLGVAIGGEFGGPFDETTKDRATMLVDWVQVSATPTTVATPELALSKEWVRRGGATSPLGDSLRAEPRIICNLTDWGCAQRFAGGRLYWSRNTGAQPVWGALGQKYVEMGADASRLGYPTAEEFCGLRDGGCAQRFQRGTMYWSHASGSHPVWGEIGNRWGQLGWERSALGYPTTDEFCGLRDGGCGQMFQNGMIYWSPGTGAQVLWGEIGKAYQRTGYENSPLGFPTGGEFCGLRDGGCGQRFQGGLIYWSPSTGANPVWGAIIQKFQEVGYENSPLGYPVTGEFPLIERGVGQRFQGGMMYWSPPTGAHPVWGLLLNQYAANRYENGLGYPTTDEIVTRDGWEQHFQRGRLFQRR